MKLLLFSDIKILSVSYAGIFYQHNSGKHFIDFSYCSQNWLRLNPDISLDVLTPHQRAWHENCVAQRKADTNLLHIEFFTDPLTRIVFDNSSTAMHDRRVLNREILETGRTTYDQS